MKYIVHLCTTSFLQGTIWAVINYDNVVDSLIHFYRATMYTEYCALSKLHMDAGSMIADVFKYNHFRQGWYAFLNLLDIDYSDGFMCDECGSCPNVVIMDATTLSFRRDLQGMVCTSTTQRTERKTKVGR